MGQEGMDARKPMLAKKPAKNAVITINAFGEGLLSFLINVQVCPMQLRSSAVGTITSDCLYPSWMKPFLSHGKLIVNLINKVHKT